MTNSGGKSPGPAWTHLIFQSRQAFFEEALSPQTHDFSACMQTACNLVIAQSIGGEKDHFGPDNLIIR
jgi:hypothetical protein